MRPTLMPMPAPSPMDWLAFNAPLCDTALLAAAAELAEAAGLAAAAAGLAEATGLAEAVGLVDVEGEGEAEGKGAQGQMRPLGLGKRADALHTAGPVAS